MLLSFFFASCTNTPGKNEMSKLEEDSLYWDSIPIVEKVAEDELLPNVQNVPKQNKPLTTRNILGKTRPVLTGDPQTDQLTKALTRASVCPVLEREYGGGEHLMSLTNEFLRKGILSDMKCKYCGSQGSSPELGKVTWELMWVSRTGQYDKEKLDTLISKCRFPNLTKKVVYNNELPKLLKEYKEYQDTQVDY